MPTFILSLTTVCYVAFISEGSFLSYDVWVYFISSPYYAVHQQKVLCQRTLWQSNFPLDLSRKQIPRSRDVLEDKFVTFVDSVSGSILNLFLSFLTCVRHSWHLCSRPFSLRPSVGSGFCDEGPHSVSPNASPKHRAKETLRERWRMFEMSQKGSCQFLRSAHCVRGVWQLSRLDGRNFVAHREFPSLCHWFDPEGQCHGNHIAFCTVTSLEADMGDED